MLAHWVYSALWEKSHNEKSLRHLVNLHLHSRNREWQMLEPNSFFMSLGTWNNAVQPQSGSSHLCSSTLEDSLQRSWNSLHPSHGTGWKEERRQERKRARSWDMKPCAYSSHLHNQTLLLAFQFIDAEMVNYRSNNGMTWNASPCCRINSFREKECIVQIFFRLHSPFECCGLLKCFLTKRGC